ncbi:GNAT family N-acetyltransferase [Algoriphagus sp.]|uniref:GNAT family N-acetyltransferase n=1 Tax=Algoriphagus sp. TaxID=1872435 RepID=UPI0025D36962|nr:GNAT family N-acetyltransferase [Algoriphagus sp.]
MVKIISANSKDLIQIQSIANHTWPHTFGGILTPKQIEYMLNWMYNLENLENQLNAGHQFFLADDAGQKLGFIGIEPNYEPEKLKIHKIYILPSAQGKGVGKKLFSKIREVAKEYDQKTLTLNVNKENKPAIDFYLHSGFKEIRREVIDIGNGFVMDDIVFELRL